MIGLRREGGGWAAYLKAKPDLWTWGYNQHHAVFALCQLLGLIDNPLVLSEDTEA